MKLNDIKLTPLLDTLQISKISDNEYFSNKYSHYISNSRLGLLNPRQGGSPESFFEGFKVNQYSPSLVLGSTVHEICLQPEYFTIADDIGKPTAKLGVLADYLYPIFNQREITIEDVKEASEKVDYFKGKITEDKYKTIINNCVNYWEIRQKSEFNLSLDKEIIYLDTKTRNTAIACINSINNNKYIQDLLHPDNFLGNIISENEQAILLDVQVDCPNGKSFILHLKSKLDNYTIDKELNTITVNDIKTIGRVVSDIELNINKYHYHREFGMYSYLLKLCAEKFYGLSNPKIMGNYLVVSTIPNYYSKVRSITWQELNAGFHEFKTLLKYAAYNIGYKNFSLEHEESGKFKF